MKNNKAIVILEKGGRLVKQQKKVLNNSFKKYKLFETSGKSSIIEIKADIKKLKNKIKKDDRKYSIVFATDILYMMVVVNVPLLNFYDSELMSNVSMFDEKNKREDKKEWELVPVGV